ncbi:MAG TPA: hypothetical protein VJG90_04210 [Candidatus Nanoarchaeia archaeon]|nr:hypothetical protein [Candidatus Nanoarchaeia archaeon]
MKRGLLYVKNNQTIISTDQGTTLINIGSMDYLCNKTLTRLLEEELIEQVADKPCDIFIFDEENEELVQHYLGRKNEFLNTSFVAAMT